MVEIKWEIAFLSEEGCGGEERWDIWSMKQHGENGNRS